MNKFGEKNLQSGADLGNFLEGGGGIFHQSSEYHIKAKLFSPSRPPPPRVKVSTFSEGYSIRAIIYLRIYKKIPTLSVLWPSI